MHNIDTYLYGCTVYVYFCNSDDIVNGYTFSYDIIVFPSWTVGSNKVRICIRIRAQSRARESLD